MHELKKVNFGIIPITHYREVVIEKLIGGWKVLGQKCLTVEEVDAVIDKNMANPNGNEVNLEDNSIFN